MDSLPEPGSPISRRSGPWRISALLLCIAAAFAAAFLQKQHRTADAAAGNAALAQPTEKSPLQILAGIPLHEGGSESDRQLAAGVARVSAGPEKADEWVRLGDLLAQKQRESLEQSYYDHAESAYLQALKLDPLRVDGMSGMAWVTGGRHVFDKSMEWANKALEIDPEHIAATGILGDAALELGDYDKAFDYYQKMMDLRPDLSSWSRGAYLLWLNGDKMRSAWLMDKAIKAGAPFGENTAWCRARLAMMHFHDGALLPAEQVLKPALSQEPPNSHVLLAAARISAAKEDYPAAIAICERLLVTGPNHEALVLAGDCHAAVGDQAAAESCYGKVEALHTAQEAKGAHDHMQMARFYADHDRNLVVSLRMAEEHKLTRNVLEADVLAWAYFKNGNLPRATEVIKIALSRNTPDAEIQYHAGMIAAASGKKQTARKHLQQALAQNGGFNPIQAPIARKTLEALGSGASIAIEKPGSSPHNR